VTETAMPVNFLTAAGLSLPGLTAQTHSLFLSLSPSPRCVFLFLNGFQWEENEGGEGYL